MNAGEGAEKREASYTVGGNVTGAATMENSMEIFQKTKNRITTWSSNPTTGHLSRQNCNLKRSMHPYIHSSIYLWRQDKEAT